jgi:hypothetical protein
MNRSIRSFRSCLLIFTLNILLVSFVSMKIICACCRSFFVIDPSKYDIEMIEHIDSFVIHFQLYPHFKCLKIRRVFLVLVFVHICIFLPVNSCIHIFHASKKKTKYRHNGLKFDVCLSNHAKYPMIKSSIMFSRYIWLAHKEKQTTTSNHWHMWKSRNNDVFVFRHVRLPRRWRVSRHDKQTQQSPTTCRCLEVDDQHVITRIFLVQRFVDRLVVWSTIGRMFNTSASIDSLRFAVDVMYGINSFVLLHATFSNRHVTNCRATSTLALSNQTRMNVHRSSHDSIESCLVNEHCHVRNVTFVMKRDVWAHDGNYHRTINK